MTAFNARKSNRTPKGRNKKDGNGQVARQRDYKGLLEALGFTRIDWNKWAYTWAGDFPVFTMRPSGINGKTGFIARFQGIEILFSYGIPPADIKVRLDDEILAIMRLQNNAADWLPADTIPIPFFLGESQSVIVEGQEIGPEIEF